MKQNYILLLLLGAICLLPVQAVRATDSTKPVETQLRERLRDTMLQLRTAETDLAALQAAQAQIVDENKALTERIAAITKQAEASRQAAQTASETVEKLKSQVSTQKVEVARLREANETCLQTAELAQTKAAEQAKVADEAVIELERLVVDRQTKNLALYKIANEILLRYQKFGLGDALAAREPFVGITRVKLENLVQDYRDKIAAERTALTEKDLGTHRDKLTK